MDRTKQPAPHDARMWLALCAGLSACAGAAPPPPQNPVPTLASNESPTVSLSAPSLPPRGADLESLGLRLQALAARHAAAPDDRGIALQLAETAEVYGRLQVATGVPATDTFWVGLQAARDVQALFAEAEAEAKAGADCWAGLLLLDWSRLSGFVEQVDNELQLIENLTRLTENPAQATRAKRALASLLAKPVDALHRDLPRAKALFEELLQHDPWDLQTRTLFAQTYAVSAQDRETYELQLKEVVERTSGNQGDPVERQIASRAVARELRLAPSQFE